MRVSYLVGPGALLTGSATRFLLVLDDPGQRHVGRLVVGRAVRVDRGPAMRRVGIDGRPTVVADAPGRVVMRRARTGGSRGDVLGQHRGETAGAASGRRDCDIKGDSGVGYAVGRGDLEDVRRRVSEREAMRVGGAGVRVAGLRPD